MLKSRKGFSMVELLVVLLIVGILAAVAAPIYLRHVERAKVSEAVGVASVIRQAEREYFTVHNAYLPILDGNNLSNDPSDATPGLGITVGASQYFSDASYTVAVPGVFSNGEASNDFVITVSGTASELAEARNEADVDGYTVQMDNSGEIFYQPGAAAPWKSYRG